MHDAGDISSTFALGEQSLKSMVRWSLPCVPQNYLVWYTHHAGGMPELSRLITKLEQGPDGIRELQAAQLFDRFFAQADEARAVKQTSDRLTETLAKLTGELGTTASNAADYQSSLQSCAQRLDNAPKPADVIAIAAQLIAQTGTMVDRVSSFQSGLAHATAETRALREELARVQQVAFTDPLTGLGNRRQLYRILGEAVARGKRQPLSLAMLDIDHFKRINDDFGHTVGDQVLKLVAGRVGSLTGNSGSVVRWGGEEFVIVLPDRTLLEARSLADQIRDQIASSCLRLKGSKSEMTRLTVSIGVAELRPPEDVDELIERADRALYVAKASGRNRVVTDTESSERRAPAGVAVLERVG